MNKAKALFSGAMILAVAGASVTCWYLNDKGIIGNTEAPTTEAYVEYENNNANNNFNDNNDKENEEPDAKDETTTAAEMSENVDISADAVNDFLSVFSKVYFSENSKYTPDNRSSYEMIRFAYSHIKRTDDSAVKIRQVDDNIGYYSCVSYDKVNEVLEKYLGITVPAESVYTENDYAFFKYSDGLFMAPAADGLPFINVAVADSIDVVNDVIEVRFGVYSGDEKYATGEAEIRITDDGMNLIYYSIEK